MERAKAPVTTILAFTTLTLCTLLLGSTIGAAPAAASVGVINVIGALPGPGRFDHITFNEADFSNTIDYLYTTPAGPSLSGVTGSGEPGNFIDSWTFGFTLGAGFTGPTHLALTLTNFLPAVQSTANFTLTSNDTSPGHGTGGPVRGGVGEGIHNVVTRLVPGHPDQLLLLADLDLPTATTYNEYDLLISGLGIDGRSSFEIAGNVFETPLPAALPLFGAALLGLGAMRKRGRRPTMPLAS